MMLNYYKELLNYQNIPDFLNKYLQCKSLKRLQKVGYFCGMDYASKSVYNFSEYISRYDHSLTTALLTYKLTKNKKQTIAALFHDIATPCFSHVIDYMNQDYEKQESTEEYTEYILKKDEYLNKCLIKDNIDIKEIINFKKFPIVDNDRPKLCADRLDGVILNSIGWTKEITKEDIKNIIEDVTIFKNEQYEDEIGFKTEKIAKKVIKLSENIDIYCHSKEDNYMMELLATITKLAIERNYIAYNDLYFYTEEEVFNIFKNINDIDISLCLKEFFEINISDILEIKLPKVKIRNLKPLIKGIRKK